LFRPALERLEDRWVPSALAIKIQSGAISFIVNDGDPGDLDVLPNQVRVQSGIGGTPAIPGFNIVTSSALTNSPGSASGALLQTSYALTALSAGGGHGHGDDQRNGIRPATPIRQPADPGQPAQR
jgi:hypothetical protein